MSKTKKLLEEKELNRFAEIAGIKKLNEEEETKSSIVVTDDGWDNIGEVVIHSLTDEGYKFLKNGGNHEQLDEETHIRDSVSLEELVDTYYNVTGRDF